MIPRIHEVRSSRKEICQRKPYKTKQNHWFPASTKFKTLLKIYLKQTIYTQPKCKPNKNHWLPNFQFQYAHFPLSFTFYPMVAYFLLRLVWRPRVTRLTFAVCRGASAGHTTDNQDHAWDVCRFRTKLANNAWYVHGPEILKRIVPEKIIWNSQSLCGDSHKFPNENRRWTS